VKERYKLGKKTYIYIYIGDIFGKTEENIIRGRSRCRPQDVDVKETGQEGRNWVNIVQDRNKSRGSYEHENYVLGSIKSEFFSDKLGNYWVLNRNLDPRSYLSVLILYYIIVVFLDFQQLFTLKSCNKFPFRYMFATIR